MRVVTFQSRDIMNALMNKGIAFTASDLEKCSPRKLSKVNSEVMFLRLDDGKIIKYTEGDNDLYNQIITSNRKDRIYPFYAYHKHICCGEMCNMSISTIYKLASHFISGMGFDTRDIIELELPDDEILLTRNNGEYEECVLPYIKKEWIVSVLWFNKYIEEPIRGENALAYRNEVFKEDTYRMCYSSSIVLSGHGSSDKVECCMSPKLLSRICYSNIQKDYVQPEIWLLFEKYCYVVRHGLTLIDIKDVDPKAAIVEMPDRYNPSLMASFNICLQTLLRDTGTVLYDIELPYKERIKLIRE